MKRSRTHPILVLVLLLAVISPGVALGVPRNLDRSFNAPWGYGTPVGSMTAMPVIFFDATVQPDGKTVAVGVSTDYMIAILRCNPDGTPDASFGQEGTVTAGHGEGQRVVIQPDGKILVNANRPAYASQDGLLIRLNADGTVDTGFGAGGVVTVGNGSDFYLLDNLVLQSDGRILVGGCVEPGAPSSAWRLFAMRFNDNGSVDTTFGGGSGQQSFEGVSVPGQTGVFPPGSLDLMPNGKIVVAGWDVWSLNPTLAVARFSPDGTLDASFGGGKGATLVDGTAFGMITPWMIAASPSGDILVNGNGPTWGQSVVVKLCADGSLDPAFGNGLGRVALADIASWPWGQTWAFFRPDGSLLLAGAFKVWKLDAGGALDPSFGTGGGAAYPPPYPNTSSTVFCVSPADDGKIVTAFYAPRPGNPYGNSRLGRFTADGQVDSSFGENGIVTARVFNRTSAEATLAILQPDMKVLVAGWSMKQGSPSALGTDILLMRYTADGQPDATFGGGSGVVRFDGGGSVKVEHLALGADGKIALVGRRLLSGTTWGFDKEFFLTRFNPDGSPDLSFGGGSMLLTQGPSSGVTGVVVQDDGKIIVTGSRQADPQNSALLLRFNTDGTPDASFPAAEGSWATLNAVKIQPDGRILIAGWGEDAFFLLRLNPDGSRDASFGTDGVAPMPEMSEMIFYPPTLALDPDGNIVMAGDLMVVVDGNGTSSGTVVRFKPDGAWDKDFGIKGMGRIFPGEAPPMIGSHLSGMDVQPDGRILTVGAQYSGIDTSVDPPRIFVARLTRDGLLDGTYGQGGIVDLTGIDIDGEHPLAANAVIAQPDGPVIVIGASGVADNFGPLSSTLVMRLQGDDMSLLSPNGGESLRPGKVATVRWISSPHVRSVRSRTAQVLLSANRGLTWRVVARDVPDTGSFAWRVPRMAGKRFKIKVLLTGSKGKPLAADDSNTCFKIVPR